MLFHRFPAWNLAHALYFDPRMKAMDNPFIQHRFQEGLAQGWISPAYQRGALEMFVLDDTPLLPPDLDIDPRPIKDHLHWVGHVAPDLRFGLMGRYQIDEIRALKGLILSNLATRRIGMSPTDFDTITSDLEEIPEQIRWAASGRDLHEIELEFSMASLSLELTRRGIPTYSQALPAVIGSPAAGNEDKPDDLAIVKFYFDNQVEVPSPGSFSEALDLRGMADKNPLVVRGAADRKNRFWQDQGRYPGCQWLPARCEPAIAAAAALVVGGHSTGGYL